MNNNQHKHKFKITSYTLKDFGEVTLSCDCGEEKERPATKAETKKFKADFKKHKQECNQMHKVWHNFSKNFYNDKYQFKWSSYEMMCKVGKWAKKYPKDVFTLDIDDGCHTGSDIVFILHRINNRLWGVSVVVITQSDGQMPNHYFMYPSHLKYIHGVLGQFLKMKKL